MPSSYDAELEEPVFSGAGARGVRAAQQQRDETTAQRVHFEEDDATELAQTLHMADTPLDNLAQALARHGLHVQRDAPLAPFTTFQIGGPAGLLAEPTSTEQVAMAVKLASELGIAYLPLGCGSNVLIADAGYPHLVLATRRLDWVRLDGAALSCGAGVTVPDLAERAAEAQLAGMENLCDVPGTLGGGLYMNAGCDGVCLGDLLQRVTWVEPDGAIVTRFRDDVRMDYRNSEFTGTGRIVTEARLQLSPVADAEALRESMREVRTRRAEKFPLPYPNCGSVFKRVTGSAVDPWVKEFGKKAYSAGFYLDRLGLKGRCCGEARISEVHANFIVNLGNASASDVLALIEEATEAVRQQFGIELEREVNLIDNTGRH